MYSNRWGAVRQLQLPSSIVKAGVISLTPPAVKVLAVLLHVHKATQKYKPHETVASATVGQKKLMLRTGLSRRTVCSAIKTLSDAGYIETLPNRKGDRKNGTGVATYTLLSPDTGIALSGAGHNPFFESGRLAYFSIPQAVVMQSGERLSLANTSASGFRLYLAILWIGTVEGLNEFMTTAHNLRKVSGLALKTYRKALDGLEEHGLIDLTGSSTGGKELKVRLCDPFTGDPIPNPEEDEDDPANWYKVSEKGVARRLITNTGTADDIERLIRSCIPDGESAQVRDPGELLIRCPFPPHSDRTPSCSVSMVKRCFHCFGCLKSGRLTELVAALTGESMAKVIQRIAGAMDPAGQVVEFHEPDSRAVAKYNYLDSTGKKLLKQVRRSPNAADGSKRFTQRRLGLGGSINNVRGVGPLLYHLELLAIAGTVCITEGERDADSVTNLHLDGPGGLIVGVTSGGAETWNKSLAKLLRGHRIVIMPDDDAAGAIYADAVAASLMANGIEFRRVSFREYGCKDASEFLESHSGEELARMIREAWEPPILAGEGVYDLANITI